MGIVKRDSIRITIISYIGAAIGYLNKILLFPNFLSAEEVGLTNIIITISAIYAQLSALGMNSVTLRFFPHFNDKSKHHHGFLFWTSFISLLGFLIVTLFCLIFQKEIVGYYAEKSPLLIEYALYIIPLGLATLFYNQLEVYLRSLMKTVMPVFINEIFMRLFISLCILLYALQLVSFHEFVILYVAGNCSIAIVLLMYAAWLKQLHLYPKWTPVTRRLFKIIPTYGLYAILSTMSFAVMSNIDSIMVGSMLGLRDTGIYTTMFLLATIMLMPYRSMVRVASPLVAQFWKKREINKINDLYKKVTSVNLVVGCLCFLLIWINADTIFYFMPEEYRLGKYALLFLCLGRLFDMATGLNGIILITSKKYRLDLLFAILLMGLMIIMNLTFIPQYGISGAALGTMLAIIIINSARTLYIWLIFKMHPFEKKNLWVTFITMAVLTINYLLPFAFNVYADVFIRTILCLLLFIVPAIALNISEDVNTFTMNVLKQLGIRK